MKYLTDKKNSDFQEKENEQNYKAVFEVKGQDLTDFKVDLIRIDPIRENISEIWP